MEWSTNIFHEGLRDGPLESTDSSKSNCPPFLQPISNVLRTPRARVFGLPSPAEALRALAGLASSDWHVDDLAAQLSTCPFLSLSLLLAVPGEAPVSDVRSGLHSALQRCGSHLPAVWLHAVAASPLPAQQLMRLAALDAHACRTAALTHELATETGACDPEHAWWAGLWHNLGQLEFAARYARYPGPLSDAREAQLAAGERAQYQEDHGALLARKLADVVRIPLLGEAIELHHAPVEFVCGMPALPRLLRAAVALQGSAAERFGEAGALTGLPHDRLATLLTTHNVEAQHPIAHARLPAPALQALLQAGFDELPAAGEARDDLLAQRLSTAFNLLCQRRLLAVVCAEGEGWRTEPRLTPLPDFTLPPPDAQSLCRGGAAEAHGPSASDWLLARQLGVTHLDVAEWQLGMARGIALLGRQPAQVPLRNEPARHALAGGLLRAALQHLQQADTRSRAQHEALATVRGEETSRARRIAHEISNPLTVIANHLALLEQEHVATDSGRQMLRQMQSEIGRTRRLLASLGQPAAPAHHSTHCAPLDILREVATLFTDSLAVQQGIHIFLRSPGSLPEVEMPPDALKQVLINLVLNAAEAIGRDGHITLGAHPDANLDNQPWIAVSVHNTGTPLPRRDTLLELPVVSSKDEAHAGVGLAVCRDLIARAGGHLLCHASADEGTTFSIFLRPLQTARSSD